MQNQLQTHCTVSLLCSDRRQETCLSTCHLTSTDTPWCEHTPVCICVHTKTSINPINPQCFVMCSSSNFSLLTLWLPREDNFRLLFVHCSLSSHFTVGEKWRMQTEARAAVHQFGISVRGQLLLAIKRNKVWQVWAQDKQWWKKEFLWQRDKI